MGTVQPVGYRLAHANNWKSNWQNHSHQFADSAFRDGQLEKLGNIENIAASLEGVVFQHKGKIYKLTGSFAMVNQIVGRAMRLPKEEIVSESYLRRLIRESLKRVYQGQ